MRICLLSYQANHRKTYDVIAGLKARGYEDVCIYAKPFHYNKTFKPIYEHRPSCEWTAYDNLKYEDVINNYGYEIRKIDNYEDINEPKGTIFLVCGASLLPETFLKRNVVINAHPGYIPKERGLDALKWTIIEGQTIGVTTHLIGDYVDAGDIIERIEVPLFENDTFHSVADRVYQIEIKLLLDSIENHSIVLTTDGGGYDVHKRMPHYIEEDLMREFDEYKRSIMEIDRRK